MIRIKILAKRFFPKFYEILASIKRKYWLGKSESKKEDPQKLLQLIEEYPPQIIYHEFLKAGHYCVPYPRTLAISLHTRCNLNCFICDREGFKPSSLKFENIFKLEKAIRFAKAIDLTGWGEPFLYPKFMDVIEYIYSQNTTEVIQITTNGTLLSADYGKLLSGHLHHLVISLNAATPEIYNRDMVHGDFENTISNVKEFISVLSKHDKQKITFSFIAHTRNFKEIPSFIDLAYKMGISKVFIGAFLASTLKRAEFTLPNVKKEYNQVINKAFVRAEKLGIIFDARKFNNEKTNSTENCVSPFMEAFVQVDGKLSPCCFSNSYPMGNVFDTSFEEVWFGAEYYKLRKSRFLPACATCTPFHIFDNPAIHLTGYFRVSKEFDKIKHLFSND